MHPGMHSGGGFGSCPPQGGGGGVDGGGSSGSGPGLPTRNLVPPPAAAQQPTPELTDEGKDSKIARLRRLFDAGSIRIEHSGG